MSILNVDNEIIVKNKCVYWVELGHKIGSELRKERPAIIWKKFKDENRYFIIPITSSNKNDSTFV